MRNKEKRPVTIAVRPDPSIPSVTCSAVERAENPDGPLNPKIHILKSASLWFDNLLNIVAKA